MQCNPNHKNLCFGWIFVEMLNNSHKNGFEMCVWAQSYMLTPAVMLVQEGTIYKTEMNTSETYAPAGCDDVRLETHKQQIVNLKSRTIPNKTKNPKQNQWSPKCLVQKENIFGTIKVK